MLVVESIRMAGVGCSIGLVSTPSLFRIARVGGTSVFGLNNPSWCDATGVLCVSDSGDWTIGNRKSASALEGDLMGRCEPATPGVFGAVEDRELDGGVSEADVELNKGELMCLGDAVMELVFALCIKTRSQDTDQSEAL